MGRVLLRETIGMSHRAGSFVCLARPTRETASRQQDRSVRRDEPRAGAPVSSAAQSSLRSSPPRYRSDTASGKLPASSICRASSACLARSVARTVLRWDGGRAASRPGPQSCKGDGRRHEISAGWQRIEAPQAKVDQRLGRTRAAAGRKAWAAEVRVVAHAFRLPRPHDHDPLVAHAAVRLL